jgi:hypothetical protein
VSLNAAITPAVVAAIVSAVILLVGHWITGRRESTSRRRELFAKAFAASIAYREFAYAIRRRRDDHSAEERVRLSEAIREVQEQLAFHAAWIEIESSRVAVAYRALLSETRRVAGGYMREAWATPAITADAEMNVDGGLDFGPLQPFESAYIAAVRAHLGFWRVFRELRTPGTQQEGRRSSP